MIIIPIHDTKSCGECSMCCEGWLSGSANDKNFYPGKKCDYLDENSKCSIYEKRPNTCRDYRCVWKIENELPDFLRPDKSKVILTYKQKGESGTIYVQSHECGTKIDSFILSCIIQFAQHKRINLIYQVDGGFFPFGEKEFVIELLKEHMDIQNKKV